MNASIDASVARLERSRSALLEHMSTVTKSAGHARVAASGASQVDDGVDLSDVATAVFESWWQQHPVRIGLTTAWGLLQGEVRRHPLRALAAAAAGAAIITWLRPWRAVAASAFVYRLAPLVNLGGLAAAFVSAAVPTRSNADVPPTAAGSDAETPG